MSSYLGGKAFGGFRLLKRDFRREANVTDGIQQDIDCALTQNTRDTVITPTSCPGFTRLSAKACDPPSRLM